LIRLESVPAPPTAAGRKQSAWRVVGRAGSDTWSEPGTRFVRPLRGAGRPRPRRSSPQRRRPA